MKLKYIFFCSVGILDKFIFYYASISSLSLGALFRYVFSILVALSLSSLQHYDASITLPQEEVMRGR